MEYPKRKPMRLKDYDYSRGGVYFLTLCAKDRALIFSRIVGRGLLDAPEVQLTETGHCVQNAMIYLAEHDPALQIENAVIMPNHVHILLAVRAGKNGASGRPRPTEMRVPKFVSSLKRHTNQSCARPLWQNGYHDHIIRDENDFLDHWTYIDQNPARWAEDEYFGGTI